MRTTSPTQRPATSHLSEAAGLTLCSGQWLLEQPDDPVKWARNELDVKICGQQGFEAVADDILRARHSVDMICYGFDPAMEVRRQGSQWPRGTTFGDLLAERALAGIRIRVLCWHGPVGAKMPGASEAISRVARRPRETLGKGQMYQPSRHFTGLPGMSLKEARREFNINWYTQIFAGDIQNLSFRTRRMSGKAADDGVAADPDAPARGRVETFGMAVAATHHQKTILIDYDLDDGHRARGYVMGLNSITDYWDTVEHNFRDPLRGEGWEGDGGEPDLMPYQDYACRIRGNALIDVDRNFCDAWNRTRATEKGGEGEPAVHRRQKGLATDLDVNHHAQIVRTHPEEKTEQSVRRLYQQAAKFARKYVYVENQYFQYTPWIEQLKAERKSYRDGWQSGENNYGKDNGPPPEIPWLHVIAITPTPERFFMVPRTHDMVKALGHGESMPKQDQRIEDEIRRHREATAYYERAMVEHEKVYQEALQRPQGVMRYEVRRGVSPAAPAPLSPLAADSLALGAKAGIKKQLDALGIRALVASLWTFDKAFRSTQEDDLRSLAEWEGTSTSRGAEEDSSLNSQRIKSRRDKLNKARYREIYIHSKLLMIDDGFFTLGSTNLNQRSMASDSEINVATDNPRAAVDLRKRVWGMLTGNAPDCNPSTNSDREIYDAFDKWRLLLKRNAKSKTLGNPLEGFLIPFHDDRTTNIRAG
ncbi:MAG TPA: phospholipase D-like domain-containing protein [Burkholderiaceae bacterium]|nr:phospholipase D-like domain-containing protein [Burkholderiaceae bacterium]